MNCRGVCAKRLAHDSALDTSALTTSRPTQPPLHARKAAMTFRDHFSRQATDYAKFRPRYPQELFDYLGSIAPGRHLAWDCGTGSGQAAVGLASVFNHVI